MFRNYSLSYLNRIIGKKSGKIFDKTLWTVEFKLNHGMFEIDGVFASLFGLGKTWKLYLDAVNAIRKELAECFKD